MKIFACWGTLLVMVCLARVGSGAETVPTDVQQPGTQPGEIGNLESPDKCDNCHGGYDAEIEPAHIWRGSMMANAGRDPIFWATLAVAEQDFDGAGDLCLRCHSTSGWLAERSTPTEGSALTPGDADGVDCDFCHKMTNPDDSEHVGEQFAPFIANDGGFPPLGYFGSGMTSIWGGNDKLGPYEETVARHRFLRSQFHRSVDFCGSCHDVSNPVVGDLAHNNGTQESADAVIASGIPGGPVEEKAAFNNFPFQYGIVERTFSEYKSSLLPQTRVRDYLSLPTELQDGAIRSAYESALSAGTDGDYEDGTPRYFSCQTCHLRPVNGPGCDKQGAPIRGDLPLHDMTGGNYWMPEAIQYLDLQGKLRLGGGLTAGQIAAMNDGIARVNQQLSQAASLTVVGDTLRIVNLTGHKLISGYPEGRRMWLNIKWYGPTGALIREDGAYGPLFDEEGDPVIVENPAGGPPVQVESLLDLGDPHTRVYEAHYGMTQEWAQQLLDLGYSPELVLDYDRYTGAPNTTLGELAAESPGTAAETFHFVLNNTVLEDNRIPPYQMDYEEARKRNALPVPATQYGGGLGGVYDHWDEFELGPHSTQVLTFATIDLLYQPTSWEYIQFLWLANSRSDPFLADEGVNMLEAWLNTGMAQPQVIASAVWGTSPVPQPTSRRLSGNRQAQ